MEIVERCRARDVLDDLFSRAREGNGRAVLITGVAGMGKTSLIHDLRTRAEASGALVLDAIASGSERDLPMGVMGQLFPGAGLSATDPAGAVDSVHHLVHRLSERAPLVITVDDVHEIDAASLQCLLYLIRRVGGAHVLVVLGERAEAPQIGSALTAEFLRNPRCALIQLTALSAEGTGSVLAGLLGPEGAAGTASGWQRASGGSPLLLRALLEDRVAGRWTTESAGPTAGEAFGLAVRYLLNQLSGAALSTARGLAVMGSAPPPGSLDRLLDLPGGAAARAVGTLEALGLTEAGQYRVEAARSTVLEDMTPEERARLHHKAARFLYEDGAATGVVARHLVAGGTLEESWILPVLRDAADQALRDNDAEWSITCLRVAHDACTDSRQRAAIRADLAQAEWEVDPAAVRRHLAGLVDDHRRGHIDLRQSIRLIAYLLWHGRPQEADEMFADLDAVEDQLGEESRVRLETMRVWFAHSYPVLGARYRHNSALAEMALGRSVGAVDPQSDGALVLHALMSEGPISNVLETAERLLQAVVLHNPPVAPAIAALASFVHAARLDHAAEWCDLLLQGAEQRAPSAWAVFAAASAAVESRLGNFDVARQRADQALSLMTPEAWGIAIGVPLAAKVLACTAQGDREGAAECFRVPVPEMMFQTLPGLHYLQARGRYHLSVRRYHAALGDFHACRDLMAAWNLDVSSSLSWRLYAAEALIELDSPVQARELLAEELTRQDSGNRWMREQSLCMLDRLGSSRLPDAGPAPAEERAEAEEAAVDGLSRAEHRVALLASQGCTNREIAAKLFVTSSTVEQHLTRIYHKLGVRGRSDLPTMEDSANAGR
ncbi:helix-turn-helix transcriptional regulator [Streptomyces sp. RKAG337]|uniref:helix-turn-helix transcriptional regulator n=1 Tax=Streptomyces sp. RKAG337 TaxID=2893404 RepID=UPI002033501D|nr:LuxR family transcriptional regulator [Streptomyces sp. RKAG337]MCM2427003.1 AAA family ATPase [Streptomyces sp. RKAG337]